MVCEWRAVSFRTLLEPCPQKISILFSSHLMSSNCEENYLLEMETLHFIRSTKCHSPGVPNSTPSPQSSGALTRLHRQLGFLCIVGAPVNAGAQPAFHPLTTTPDHSSAAQEDPPISPPECLAAWGGREWLAGLQHWFVCPWCRRSPAVWGAW